MAEIRKITKQTDNTHLNMFELEAVTKSGRVFPYEVASRSLNAEDLKINTGKDTADGVIIYALYGEAHDQVVLIRQYRYPIGGFIYELPAGLCEKGEDFHEGAIRELHEETGLTLTPLQADSAYEAPRYTSVGMSDEAVAIVYGYASGEVSSRFTEDSEEIEVILADRTEARRILKEERVAVQCAYQLMHFIADEEPFRFLHA